MTNQNLLAIAKEYGSPIYVYDAAKIESQYNRLTGAFKKVKVYRSSIQISAKQTIPRSLTFRWSKLPVTTNKIIQHFGRVSFVRDRYQTGGYIRY